MLFLDDADALPEALVPQVRSLIRDPPANAGPIVVAYGRFHPAWLGAELRAVCAEHTVASLSTSELKSAVRNAVANGTIPVTPSRVVLDACVVACGGDARQLVNMLLLNAGAPSSSPIASGPANTNIVAATRVPPQLDAWSAARHLMYARLGIEDVERIYHAQPEALLASIIHANYLQAVTFEQAGVQKHRSYAPSWKRDPDHSTGADLVCMRSDLLSAAQAMRTGSTHQTVEEAKLIIGAVAVGAGRKNASQTPRLVAPRAGGFLARNRTGMPRTAAAALCVP
jgi:hypothetical protein